MVNNVTVKELVDSLKLVVHNGEDFLTRTIQTTDLSRPGLELTGYFNYYPKERLQLFGRTEISFSERMSSDERLMVFRRMCQPETPAFLVSRDMVLPKELIQATTENDIPLLSASYATTRLASNVTNFLEERLAERESVHGVLIDIYGMGVIITGDSGVGKSETALELIQRGHRLVADDRVELHVVGENRLIGEPPEILRNLLEIRGVGIIDVASLFGVGSIRLSKVVNLIVNLELWDKNTKFDRLGSADGKRRIQNVDVPLISIPVKTGRNLSVIIEAAAMNHRAKQMGHNATETFERNLEKLIKTNSEEA
jgi:HPr kinase/phosphorylase